VPGTTTLKQTWGDPSQFGFNTNPIILDAAGRCVMYGDGSYRLVLYDAVGNLIWDQPSSTVISAAMAPVVSAPTIADALVLLGLGGTSVAEEAAARAAADSAEANARIAADNAEASARAAADSAEATARANADTTETNARIAGDNNLQSQISALGSGAATLKSGTATVPFVGIGSPVHITFPSAFPTAATAMTVTGTATDWPGTGIIALTFIVTGLTASGADVWVYAAGTAGGGPTTTTFYWIATGH
jgi:hypothetical protein